MCRSVADGKDSLFSLFNRAHQDSRISCGGLDELDEEDYEDMVTARPAGYCAQTQLSFGGLSVPALLDYGATCSAIPEEVAVAIMCHAWEMLDTGVCTEEEQPVRRLQRITRKPKVDGIAVGAGIEIGYAVVLRAEFVPCGGVKGPKKDLYFKVFPTGRCQVPRLNWRVLAEPAVVLSWF